MTYNEHELSIICSTMNVGVGEMMVVPVPNPLKLIGERKKQVLRSTSKTHMALNFTEEPSRIYYGDSLS